MIYNDDNHYPHLTLPHQLGLVLQLRSIFVGVLVLVPEIYISFHNLNSIDFIDSPLDSPQHELLVLLLLLWPALHHNDVHILPNVTSTFCSTSN